MKRLASFILAVVLLVTMAGCGAKVKSDSKSDTSMFVLVEETFTWKVVYQKETKVMYAVSYGSYNYGTFTLLVNPDGSPMLWND